MTGTFHDGLRALQGKTGTEALDHREIAVAMKQVSELGKTKLLVKLGVLATSDVEIQRILRLSKGFDAKTSSSGPDAGNFFHAVQIVTKLLRQSFPILPGELHNEFTGDFIRPILANSPLKSLKH